MTPSSVPANCGWGRWLATWPSDCCGSRSRSAKVFRYSDDAVPQEVAEAIVERTGGQPYLTQLYGFWLVEELNKTKRRHAELTDVETVDLIVFEQAGPFFRDSLNPRGATFAVKPVIEQISAGQTPEITAAQSRFLMRRGLITAEGTLAFPILARWLNEYAE